VGAIIDVVKPSSPQTPPVLVVDDDPVFRSLVRLWLGIYGFDTLEAGSAAEAVESASAHPVHAIVSDYSMPGATGLDLLYDLRAAGSSVPFVLTSNLFPPGVPPAARAAGADAVEKRRLIEALPGLLAPPAIAA
jgi:two-component system chemotaxis response regulator CheY